MRSLVLGAFCRALHRSRLGGGFMRFRRSLEATASKAVASALGRVAA